MASKYVAKIRPGIGGAPKGTIPWNKGKHRIVTWGQAISNATRGIPKSASHRAKIGAAHKGRKLSPAHRQKLSIARIGIRAWNKGLTKAKHGIRGGCPKEKHWNWKGGISLPMCLLRQTSEYKCWRKSVFIRDNWTCQDCGKRGGYLEAHHIKPFSLHPELRFELSNGETLCKSCHKKKPRQ